MDIWQKWGCDIWEETEKKEETEKTLFFCTISITFLNSIVDIWQKWGCDIWEETDTMHFFCLFEGKKAEMRTC